MTAKELLKEKGIKDTVFDSNEHSNWRKGGLSGLMEEYADIKAKDAYEAGQDRMGCEYETPISVQSYEQWKISQSS